MPYTKPTELQKRAVKILVDKGGSMENIGETMMEAGYSKTTAHTPTKLTESEGFLKELENYGLTKELVTMALVEDIEKKPQNRSPELKLATEVLGMKKNEGTNVNVNIGIALVDLHNKAENE